MTDKIKFTFLARPDDLTALAQLAGSCDRSRAAMLRKLIRDADRQQKKPLITLTPIGTDDEWSKNANR